MDSLPAVKLIEPKSLTITSAAARQILMDRYSLDRLRNDNADLKRIVDNRDSTIRRLTQSVLTLSNRSPTSADPVRIRPPTVPAKPPNRVNWPKVENWAWRSLFTYLAYQSVRSLLTR